MITYYFNKDKLKEKGDDTILPPKKSEEKKGNIDDESLKGRFGWMTIHNVHIPYIFRHDEMKYCAVRMVENKILNKYLSFLPSEITTCIAVRSYYITEIESKLFNEINIKHCDHQFGRDAFTVKDLVVRVYDAKYFYKFLDTVYKKLVQKSSDPSEYCGFVRINGESVVPYTVKAGSKFVPLFYFEGETDTLKLKAEKIEGWELAFLKFCCKVQGIRNELFASDTCSVVSLDDVKQYFPKDTKFEDWWPQKTAEPMRTSNPGTKPGGNWTQRPAAPPNPSPIQQITAPPAYASPPTQKPILPIHKTSTVTAAPTASPALNNVNITNLYNQWAATLMNGQAAAAAQAQALAAAYANYPALLNMNQEHMRRVNSLAAANPLIQSLAVSIYETLLF